MDWIWTHILVVTSQTLYWAMPPPTTWIQHKAVAPAFRMLELKMGPVAPEQFKMRPVTPKIQNEASHIRIQNSVWNELLYGDIILLLFFLNKILLHSLAQLFHVVNPCYILN